MPFFTHLNIFLESVEGNIYRTPVVVGIQSMVSRRFSLDTSLKPIH